MVTITVVEPNTLLRLGILNLLETLDCRVASQGIDYVQLFDGAKPHTSGADLMLLSVPATYDHVRELVATAQQRFDPRRILLLSDTQEPSYPLSGLPSVLTGYVCKFASQDILKASIMLALAGGKCFPRPDTKHAVDTPGEPSVNDKAAPRRRWYDHSGTDPCRLGDDHVTDSLPGPAPMIEGSPEGHPALSGATVPGAASQQALAPDVVKQEAALLHLTPRQYGVLALMAKGYPLKKISRELAISVATVKTHTEAVYQRLGVNNRTAAVYAATSRGATLGCRNGPQDTANRQPAPGAPDDASD